MSTSLKLPWRRIITLGLTSIIGLFVLFKTVASVHDVTAVFSSIQFTYFWIAFFMMVPTFVLCALRWYSLLRATGIVVRFRTVFTIILRSISLSVIPGRLGDLLRGYPIRNSASLATIVGTIVFEKVLDICVLVLFSSLGLFALGMPLWGITLLVVAFSIIPGLMIVHTLYKRWALQSPVWAKLNDAFLILKELRQRKSFFALGVVSSMANWGLSMIQMYFLFRAVHAPVSLVMIFAYVPLSIFIGLLPITLAGIGTRDTALIGFFSTVAVASQSLSVGILYGLQSYWIPAILALPLLMGLFRDHATTVSQ